LQPGKADCGRGGKNNPSLFGNLSAKGGELIFFLRAAAGVKKRFSQRENRDPAGAETEDKKAQIRKLYFTKMYTNS
jgi:hypothetical protein